MRIVFSSFLFPIMIFVQSGLTLAIFWLGAYLINDVSIPLTGTLAQIMTVTASRADMLCDVVAFTSYAMYVVMPFVLLMAIFVVLPRAQMSLPLTESETAAWWIRMAKLTKYEKERPTRKTSSIRAMRKARSLPFRMLSLDQKKPQKLSILRVCGIINFSCPVASIFPQKQITSKKFGKSGFSKSRFFKNLNPSKK